ncbi:MAG: Hsp20/alpha crystallin family protein [Opitutales bacterium]
MSTQITCQNSADNASADTNTYRRPAYRIEELDDAYAVSVEIPGVAKDAVDISTEQGTLSVKANRKDLVPAGAKVIRRESRDYGYQLNLKLGPQVDAQKISASLENGVLTLRLEKAAEAQARRISVA